MLSYFSMSAGWLHEETLCDLILCLSPSTNDDDGNMKSSMERSRSSQAHQRKRRLLDATQHVSAASEIAVVRSLAGGGIELVQEAVENEAINDVVHVLRNAKNSVYHRAMAARALGLLVRQDDGLAVRLQMESEELVDALLQLLHYCRRHPTQNADTRRVHVNCCLVVAMVMQLTQTSQSPPHLQLVVSLESELLQLPPRPTERDSGFLLLTVSGRPETADTQDSSSPKSSVKTRPQMLPPALPMLNARGRRCVAWETHQNEEAKNQEHQDTGTKNTEASVPVTKPKPKSSALVATLPTMAQEIARRQTPTREFKMDRFRVVTPIMTRHSHASTPLPVIPPTRQGIASPPSSSNNQHEEEPRQPASGSFGNSLLPAQHMITIIQSGQMPVASAKYFHRHLRDEEGVDERRREESTARAPSRLQVIEWGEWKRRGLSGDEGEKSDPILEKKATPVINHVHSPPEPVLPTSPGAKTAVEDVSTPEYKRQRLRDILSTPIEPFERNTAQLQALADRVSTSVMASLGAEAIDLRNEEARTRQQMSAFIDEQRDKLPLKFLFQLPGGAAYCRHRMRRAMELWVHEFEVNQRRMALVQWKAVVEHARFRERGATYHRIAVEKRMRAAIAYVLRGYQQQAILAWKQSIRLFIWHDRDAAIRFIQRQVRRRQALLRFLGWHDAHPIASPHLRDVYLAPYREANVLFVIPRRVREERRHIWFAAELVQGIYRRRRFRTFLQRYRVAAIKIQARARMRIARASYRILRRRIILFQAQLRMQRCYRAYHSLRDATLLVQINFRAVRIRRLRRMVVYAQRRAHEHRLTAILLIQRIARGFLGRCDARRRQQQCDDEFRAALVVQRCWYRRNNEWSTFLLLGCLREKENEEIAFDKNVLRYKRNHLAKQIQHAYAAHRQRRRSQAALRIQCTFRRWRATCQVHRCRLELMGHRRIKWFLRVHHRIRIEMATKLQFWWLQAIPRRLETHLRERRHRLARENQRLEYERTAHAATKLQAVARGRRGRRVAKRERSACTLQRGIRSWLAWRHLQREIVRIKHELAQTTANMCVQTAFNAVFDRRMARLHGAATEIQRFVRGLRWRSILTRAIVNDELRARMARRIQHLWRQNAQYRVAKRLRAVQQRRLTNPYQAITSIATVLQAIQDQALVYYNPRDELRGMHLALWLRRLGMDDAHLATFQKQQPYARDTDGGLARLRKACEGQDAAHCRELLLTLGVDDDTDLHVMSANLLASETVEHARRLRTEVAQRKTRLVDEEKRGEWLTRQLGRAESTRDTVASQLEDVLQEATEFRNPPKALRFRRETLSKELQQAQQAVDTLRGRITQTETSCGQQREALEGKQRELNACEKDEVGAVFNLQNFAQVASLSVARSAFLETFPGLEARALTFVGALDEGQVLTKWQLTRFFQRYKTVSDVKLHTKRVFTQFAMANEVQRYDNMRFQACAELLLYAYERLGELLGISVERIALPLPVEASSPLIERLLLTLLHRTKQLSLARDRVCTWLEGVEELHEMNRLTTRVQTHWRRRTATKSLHVLRSHRRRDQLQASYVAEMNADYVTPVWKAERDREREEYEQWEEAETLARRVEIIESVIRYPYHEDWDADAQMTVYCTYTVDGEREWVLYDRPVYTVDEDDASIRIQALVRRFLARSRLIGLQRQRRRDERRWRLEREWQSHAEERAQGVTLRLGVDVDATDDVARWLQQRKRRAAAAADTDKSSSPTKNDKRRKLQPRFSKRKSDSAMNPTASAAIEDVERAVAPALSDCERQYNRSMRAEQRRHGVFHVNARPLNAHATATLGFLDAFELFQRQLVPATQTATTITYTRAGIRFGWQRVPAENSEMKAFYYLPATQMTTWTRPEYSFDEEYAAMKIQSVARMVLAQNKRLRLLAALSLGDLVYNTLRETAPNGWIGLDLEGMSTSVFLARLGLSKYASSLSKLSILDLVRLPEARLNKLGVTQEEKTLLQQMATSIRIVTSRRQRTRMAAMCTMSPLLAYTLTLPPSTTHAFNIVSTQRSLQQLVAQRFPNQQGRVLGLVRGLQQSTTPIAYRQLEMHLRLYAGRPDDALRQCHEIASLKIMTQGTQEQEILNRYVRCVERCVVLAANRRLRTLQHELTLMLRVAEALVVFPSDKKNKEEEDAAKEEIVSRRVPIPFSTLKNEEIETYQRAALARYPIKTIKGMWEHDVTGTSRLAPVQAALYLREEAIGRVLRWEHSALCVQATFRMHRTHQWYLVVRAMRHGAARTMQCAWRVYCAWEQRRLFLSQLHSDYEQCYDALTQTFSYRYIPTNESLLDEPRDARGHIVAYRPMVQDRVTKRWILAWPQRERLLSKGDNTREDDDDDSLGGSPCSICHVARAVRRCNECYSSTGDYVDHCLVCFYDRHAPDNTETNWHAFTTLQHAKTTVFHCVECKRFSTRRCLMCDEHYCARCFARVHGKGHMRRRHKVEEYDAQARVCVECEARVAYQLCQVCQDAMCEDCMARTHARGHKTTHTRVVIKQTLLSSDAVYCALCDARHGDSPCPYCSRAICSVCLTARGAQHASVCVETALKRAQDELFGDTRCVECERVADRVCTTCGDRYCSVRWMGNPGCFERFHSKGKRQEHSYEALEIPEPTPELRALEDAVKQKRRRDAEAAEQEAKQMAASLLAMEQAEKAKNAIKKTGKKKKSKRRLTALAPRATCRVEGCDTAPLTTSVPFCATHLTSQHALELTKADPLEAAKLLALLETRGGVLTTPRSRSGAVFRGLMQLTKTNKAKSSSEKPTAKKKKTKKAKTAE
ncbi:hypothetical protein Poli38472_003336 [Pythium oligandrum]|uniref:WW domain-containing protein n=1 Tax=Pythium oligandrum TaxID=41045 RepID=A0A8K1C6B9_PYTOL|nr:hypothetical protein Poli38472_003336 [Pythium oligandrum]|eukprot:TMW57411.1 hypothetical protein Poli38472_003336 [Pythium oligandrum]